MSILVSLLLGFVGLFLFSFILWKRLREDYRSDDIFTFTLSLVLSGLVSFWLSSEVIPSLSFWFTLLGSGVTGFVLIRRYSFRFFEVIDALVPAFFLLGLFLFKNYLSLVFIISFMAYKFLEKRYRRFSWYPSGKIGFAGLASLALFFLLYGLLAILPVGVLSLNQDLPSSLAGAVLVLVLVLVLFFRSGLVKNGKEKKN